MTTSENTALIGLVAVASLLIGCASGSGEGKRELAQPSRPDIPSSVDAAVERLARGLASPVDAEHSLAVLDIQNLEGETPILGRYLAERLTTVLSPPEGDFSVIERRQLDQVLSELEFAQSDLVDPEAAKEFGRMAGVDALVVGSLSDLGDAVEINTRVVEVETTGVVAAARATVEKDDNVSRMLARVVESREGTGKRDTGEREPEKTAAQATSGERGEERNAQAADLPSWRDQELLLEVVDIELAGDRTVVTFMITRLDNADTFEHFDLDGGRHDDGDYLVDDRGKRYMAEGSEPATENIDLVPGVPVRYSVIYPPLDDRVESFRIVHQGRYQGDLAVLGPVEIPR